MILCGKCRDNLEKNKKASQNEEAFSAYPRPGSNRHAFKGQGILSPSCLPIPPLRHLHKKSRTESGPCGAENETRTRDPDLGKVVLYQLSYFRLRIARQKYNFFQYRKHFRQKFSNFFLQIGGEGIICSRIMT